MSQRIKYSQKEIESLSSAELERVINEPNWVIHGKEIVRVSDDEYAKVVAEYDRQGDAFRGDIL